MTDETTNAEVLAEEEGAAAETTGPASQADAGGPVAATEAAGESGSKASFPTWVLVAVIAGLAILLACACLMVMGVGGLWIADQSQPDAPVIIAPPAQEQPTQAPPEPPAEHPTQPPPEQPTQPPPEQPTQPPPEQPAEPPPEEPAEPPPEQPAEPPPEEPAEPPPEGEAPAPGQLPAEPETGSPPCVPLAGGLVLAPLLVIGKKHGRRQGPNQ